MTHHIPPADFKITDDDETIAAALEDASIPTLMMSMIHMSGDTSLLNGKIKPQACNVNEVQGQMSEQDMAAVRVQALEVIKAYRDNDCQLPTSPSTSTINKMMDFFVAGEVPAEYVDMMLEEMELDGEDLRAVQFDASVPEKTKQAFKVLVIGGGMSGILAAIRLEEAGIPYTVIEKNPAVGGTWYENSYPGCRVDVGNHFYCFSFEPNHQWTQYFSKQPELQRYFENCLEKYDIKKNFRFSTEVNAARFDDKIQQWSVTLNCEDGSQETVEVNSLISCVGQLNRPLLPDIKGIDTFKGTACHSAQWIKDLDLTGKKVAVIGTGASAFQLVPEVAKVCDQLNVFQRSAPWMFENPNYHREISEETKWLFEHLPFYSRWYRFLLFWSACDGLLPFLKIDPEWPHQDRSINERNDQSRQRYLDYLRRQVGDNEELIAKATPSYVCGGKRMLQDNGSWLGALTRDNVTLDTDGIESINETGILTKTGQQYDVDVIVYATGFKANKFLWPMDIIGRNGTVLSEQWNDDPAAYLGITVPNFPNLFCLYGPNTNLASGGSLIFHSECQIRYTMGCIKTLMENNLTSMEVKQDIHDDYNVKLEDELAQMVWSHHTINNSWYQNSKGRVTTLSPWRLLDYWQWTKEPNADDYILRKADAK